MSDALKTTGNGGIALIKQYEGLRLTTYKDAVGIPTIGYGHVENPIPPGGTRTITAEDAEQILREDLQRFEHDVNNMLTVEVTQNQFDALVSFAFNLGPANLKSSTLLRKVNSGDFNGAAEEFPKWNHAGGQVLAGLTARRNAEKTLFLS
ncbi:lysozyme [Enterobacter kobei]|uniref:Lysozyme n=1 Tax=Enterobacter kobei TaxID=208224 RepID=A0AAJ6MLW3_9ENTR|nr:lysozyme [Enterobacter kobei]RHX67785.1 lysozyme [Lacticaseibacillus paracasei]GJA02907.1 lysozyme [Enterobacter cloacae]EHF8262834.1 lysozyme [Enterobacter kobei]ELK6696116.1 lysozyme [Enterobacter kobei]KJL62377.1 muraminidase [Enterobacter kobei]